MVVNVKTALWQQKTSAKLQISGELRNLILVHPFAQCQTELEFLHFFLFVAVNMGESALVFHGNRLQGLAAKRTEQVNGVNWNLAIGRTGAINLSEHRQCIVPQFPVGQ